MKVIWEKIDNSLNKKINNHKSKTQPQQAVGYV